MRRADYFCCMERLPLILGLTGFAGVGKDSAASYLEDYCQVHEIPFQKLKISDAIKQQIYSWPKYQAFLKKTGIRAETEDRAEKALVRPLIEEFGALYRNRNPYHWIDVCLGQWNKVGITAIADLRYDLEALMVRVRYGRIIRLTKTGVQPASDEEMSSIAKIEANEVWSMDNDNWKLRAVRLIDLHGWKQPEPELQLTY